jgi:hypothetical protein
MSMGRWPRAGRALQGTPTPAEIISSSAIVWATGADPAAQNITVPADATAVYFVWSFWLVGSHNISSVTLNGSAPSQSHGIAGDASLTAIGVAAWYNPPTGSRSLDVAWSGPPNGDGGGPVSGVIFVKNGNTTSWRDADSAHASGTTQVSVTLTTVAGDLVIKFDQTYLVIPSNSSGWTSLFTSGITFNVGGRAASISATGATQVCDSENENSSALVAFSIPAG